MSLFKKKKKKGSKAGWGHYSSSDKSQQQGWAWHDRKGRIKKWEKKKK